MNPLHVPHVTCFAVLGVLALVACVPRDAGYEDVRRTTADRIGRDVRWRYLDGGGAVEKRTREILSKPLTANAAVDLALLRNDALQAAFEDLGVARAALVQALALPNPSAEVGVRFHSSSRPEITLRALESLSGLVFLPLRNGVAHSRLEAAKASVVASILDLAFDARKTFYEYQAAAEILELRRTVLETTRASFEAALAIHQAGNATDLALANERALYEEARISHELAEAAATTAREKLLALIGLSGSRADWTIELRLEEPPAKELPTESLENHAIERSLDLRIVRHRLEAAAKKANLSRVEGLLPDLRVGAEAEREEEWAIGPSAVVTIPLFYQGQGEVDAALSDIRRQQASYKNTAVRIRAAARSARARLAAARTRAGYYGSVLVPLRQQIVNDTQLEYNAMSVGVFQLLQAKREQIETARAYVEQLRDYWIARSEVEELEAGRLVQASMNTDVREPLPADPRPGHAEP